MKALRVFALMTMVMIQGSGLVSQERRLDYPTQSVPFTDVTFTDHFWAPRLETVRTVTLPAVFKQTVDTGRIKNFEIAGGLAEGAFCSRYAVRRLGRLQDHRRRVLRAGHEARSGHQRVRR